ncbi:MAG: hypothetical protein JSW40_04520, partial [Candidatus Omnitrophota bacterium]
MKERYKFITKNNWPRFLEGLSQTSRVMQPWGEGDYLWQEYKKDFCFNEYRAITSVRQFLIPSVEYIDRYFESDPKERKPFCILGLKSCDLHSLHIQDHVFLGQEPDPRYKTFRDANLFISSDCLACKDVCFCLALHINPYPEEFFDLNLSKLTGGYFVEVGSAKGAQALKEHGYLF